MLEGVFSSIRVDTSTYLFRYEDTRCPRAALVSPAETSRRFRYICCGEKRGPALMAGGKEFRAGMFATRGNKVFLFLIFYTR